MNVHKTVRKCLKCNSKLASKIPAKNIIIFFSDLSILFLVLVGPGFNIKTLLLRKLFFPFFIPSFFFFCAFCAYIQISPGKCWPRITRVNSRESSSASSTPLKLQQMLIISSIHVKMNSRIFTRIETYLENHRRQRVVVERYIKKFAEKGDKVH